jgi:hypothetical protein
MKTPDGASELPHLTNGANRLSVVSLARHRPEGRQSRCSLTVLQLNSNDLA